MRSDELYEDLALYTERLKTLNLENNPAWYLEDTLNRIEQTKKQIEIRWSLTFNLCFKTALAKGVYFALKNN